MPDTTTIQVRNPGGLGDGNQLSGRGNSRGDQSVALGLPVKSELVRLGGSWSVQIATASAFTYVAAWPTTRAELILYNGDPVKSLVIDSAWLFGISSMAAAQPVALLGQLIPSGAATAPTNSNTTSLINSMSGKNAYSGRLLRAVAVTTMLANSWQILASGVNAPMTTNLGMSIYGDLYGGYIVPPGAAFGLAAVAGTAAGTAIVGCNFHEVAIDLS